MSLRTCDSLLRTRDTALRELMDDPDCDPDRLATTLRRFGGVNRVVSGWGGVYRAHVRPHLARLRHPARILDIGSGGGDLLVRLVELAHRDGFDVVGTGIDPDARALASASARIRPGIAFRCTDTASLVAAGERFDVVVSNHVLHHLDSAELPTFAADSLVLARGPVLHSDIARGGLAYALYAVGITPFAAGSFLRTDGLRSIRRSYRRGELAAALEEAAPGSWRVEERAPFRLLAVGGGAADPAGTAGTAGTGGTGRA